MKLVLDLAGGDDGPYFVAGCDSLKYSEIASASWYNRYKWQPVAGFRH
jgi:hypothetical protein